jgi:hypothetical protein
LLGILGHLLFLLPRLSPDLSLEGTRQDIFLLLLWAAKAPGVALTGGHVHIFVTGKGEITITYYPSDPFLLWNGFDFSGLLIMSTPPAS